MSAPAASTPDQRIGRDAPAPVSDAEATRLFPWILPLIGVTATVGPWLGIVIGVVAIGFNIASIRRFWISRHRWRWGITALNLSVIALLTVLLVDDLIDVFK